MRKLSIKYFVLSILGILGIVISTYYILHTTYYIPPALAQTASCPVQSSNPRVKDGLISASEITSTKFSQEQGVCVVDSVRAPFLSLEIPDYADLKSIYFDQSKSSRKDTISGDATQGNVESKINNSDSDHLIHIAGSLTIQSNGFLNGKPAIPIVIFVQNNLTINKDIDFAHTFSSGGLIFVVQGNVIIGSTVTQIDAVLISSGTIYTAGNDCVKSVVTAAPLVINGSLISLNKDKPIKFCRKLTSSNAAAEQIIHQPKYLVILKDIFSNTLQEWAEIP